MSARFSSLSTETFSEDVTLRTPQQLIIDNNTNYLETIFTS